MPASLSCATAIFISGTYSLRSPAWHFKRKHQNSKILKQNHIKQKLLRLRKVFLDKTQPQPHSGSVTTCFHHMLLSHAYIMRFHHAHLSCASIARFKRGYKFLEQQEHFRQHVSYDAATRKRKNPSEHHIARLAPLHITQALRGTHAHDGSCFGVGSRHGHTSAIS